MLYLSERMPARAALRIIWQMSSISRSRSGLLPSRMFGFSAFELVRASSGKGTRSSVRPNDSTRSRSRVSPSTDQGRRQPGRRQRGCRCGSRRSRPSPSGCRRCRRAACRPSSAPCAPAPAAPRARALGRRLHDRFRRRGAGGQAKAGETHGNLRCMVRDYTGAPCATLLLLMAAVSLAGGTQQAGAAEKPLGSTSSTSRAARRR